LNLKDIPKIDCEYLIYFNLLQAGERSTEIVSFRRHIQYALYLVSGKIGDIAWVEKASSEVAESMKTKKSDEDYEFLLYSGLAMKIIQKMMEKNMIKEEPITDGLEI